MLSLYLYKYTGVQIHVYTPLQGYKYTRIHLYRATNTCVYTFKDDVITGHEFINHDNTPLSTTHVFGNWAYTTVSNAS